MSFGNNLVNLDTHVGRVNTDGTLNVRASNGKFITMGRIDGGTNSVMSFGTLQNLDTITDGTTLNVGASDGAMGRILGEPNSVLSFSNLLLIN